MDVGEVAKIHDGIYCWRGHKVVHDPVNLRPRIWNPSNIYAIRGLDGGIPPGELIRNKGLGTLFGRLDTGIGAKSPGFSRATASIEMEGACERSTLGRFVGM